MIAASKRVPFRHVDSRDLADRRSHGACRRHGQQSGAGDQKHSRQAPRRQNPRGGEDRPVASDVLIVLLC